MSGKSSHGGSSLYNIVGRSQISSNQSEDREGVGRQEMSQPILRNPSRRSSGVAWEVLTRTTPGSPEHITELILTNNHPSSSRERDIYPLHHHHNRQQHPSHGHRQPPNRRQRKETSTSYLSNVSPEGAGSHVSSAIARRDAAYDHALGIIDDAEADALARYLDFVGDENDDSRDNIHPSSRRSSYGIGNLPTTYIPTSSISTFETPTKPFHSGSQTPFDGSYSSTSDSHTKVTSPTTTATMATTTTKSTTTTTASSNPIPTSNTDSAPSISNIFSHQYTSHLYPTPRAHPLDTSSYSLGRHAPLSSSFQTPSSLFAPTSPLSSSSSSSLTVTNPTPTSLYSLNPTSSLKGKTSALLSPDTFESLLDSPPLINTTSSLTPTSSTTSPSSPTSPRHLNSLVSSSSSITNPNIDQRIHILTSALANFGYKGYLACPSPSTLSLSSSSSTSTTTTTVSATSTFNGSSNTSSTSVSTTDPSSALSSLSSSSLSLTDLLSSVLDVSTNPLSSSSSSSDLTKMKSVCSMLMNLCYRILYDKVSIQTVADESSRHVDEYKIKINRLNHKINDLKQTIKESEMKVMETEQRRKVMEKDWLGRERQWKAKIQNIEREKVKIQRRDTQYRHEVRKLERKCTELQDKLLKTMANKNKECWTGMRILNPTLGVAGPLRDRGSSSLMSMALHGDRNHALGGSITSSSYTVSGNLSGQGNGAGLSNDEYEVLIRSLRASEARIRGLVEENEGLREAVKVLDRELRGTVALLEKKVNRMKKAGGGEEEVKRDVGKGSESDGSSSDKDDSSDERVLGDAANDEDGSGSDKGIGSLCGSAEVTDYIKDRVFMIREKLRHLLGIGGIERSYDSDTSAHRGGESHEESGKSSVRENLDRHLRGVGGETGYKCDGECSRAKELADQVDKLLSTLNTVSGRVEGEKRYEEDTQEGEEGCREDAWEATGQENDLKEDRWSNTKAKCISGAVKQENEGHLRGDEGEEEDEGEGWEREKEEGQLGIAETLDDEIDDQEDGGSGNVALSDDDNPVSEGTNDREVLMLSNADNENVDERDEGEDAGSSTYAGLKADLAAYFLTEADHQRENVTRVTRGIMEKNTDDARVRNNDENTPDPRLLTPDATPQLLDVSSRLSSSSSSSSSARSTRLRLSLEGIPFDLGKSSSTSPLNPPSLTTRADSSRSSSSSPSAIDVLLRVSPRASTLLSASKPPRRLSRGRVSLSPLAGILANHLDEAVSLRQSAHIEGAEKDDDDNNDNKEDDDEDGKREEEGEVDIEAVLSEYWATPTRTLAELVTSRTSRIAYLARQSEGDDRLSTRLSMSGSVRGSTTNSSSSTSTTGGGRRRWVRPE